MSRFTYPCLIFVLIPHTFHPASQPHRAVCYAPSLSLFPLPFLNPACTSGSSQLTCCSSLAWRILSITLLACMMSTVIWKFEHGTTDSMDISLSKLQVTVKDRESWFAAVVEVTKSQTRLNDWTTKPVSLFLGETSSSNSPLPSLY